LCHTPVQRKSDGAPAPSLTNVLIICITIGDHSGALEHCNTANTANHSDSSNCSRRTMTPLESSYWLIVVYSATRMHRITTVDIIAVVGRCCCGSNSIILLLILITVNIIIVETLVIPTWNHLL
jgi:hypothetical protein